MNDEWDALAEDIKQGKFDNAVKQEKTYRPSDPQTIITEVRGWWSGINDGSIKFIHGMPLLKDFIPAYIPGHLIAVSGYTSAGKSQLLSQLISWTAGIQEADTLVFSLEDARMEKLISLISVVTETIHRKRMLLGEIEDCSEEIEKTFKIIEGWPLNIYDDVYLLPDMERLIKKHKPKIVILDYIQNIMAPGNLYERMSMAAPYVFRIAQENALTMFVASQIDNDSAKNEQTAFIALKGGGELAAASHSVIHLQKGREEKNRHQIKIQIKKNKAFGNCGEIECEFNEYWTRINRTADQWTI